MTRPAPARRAFTLLELLLVLAILALAGLAIFPTLARGVERDGARTVRTNVRQLVADARLHATRSGVATPIEYDATRSKIDAGEHELELPEGWRVRAIRVAESTARAGSGEDDPGRSHRTVLMVWAPSGLASACDWAVVGPGAEVRVWGDAIDGIRIH